MAWQASRKRRTRRLGLLAAAGAGIVLLLGAGAAALWLALSAVREDAPLPPVPRSTPAASAETATVQLEGVPDGARVSLDGAPMPGSEIRLPRATGDHELRVEATGFEPWTQRVSFERDSTVSVALRPVQSASGPTSTRDAGVNAAASVSATDAAPQPARPTRPSSTRPPRHAEPVSETPRSGGTKQSIHTRFGSEFE